MNLLLNIADLFLKKPLLILNNLIDGYKTYLAGALIILPALACCVQYLLNAYPIDLNDLNSLIHSDCVKQLGEGLAVIGLGHKLSKAS